MSKLLCAGPVSSWMGDRLRSPVDKPFRCVAATEVDSAYFYPPRTVKWVSPLGWVIIINVAHGVYGLLAAAYIGELVAHAGWLDPKVTAAWAVLYSSRELSELSSELLQWLCHDNSTINIVHVIRWQLGLVPC